jgi:hypothetical protein
MNGTMSGMSSFAADSTGGIGGGHSPVAPSMLWRIRSA